MFLRKTGSLLLCLLMVLSGAYALLTTSTAEATQVAASTNCPAPGTGRAAFLPPLTLGKHQNLIYHSSQYATNGVVLASTLKRYDVTTKQTTTIFMQSNRDIVSPQVSGDGEWVLFSSVQSNGANTNSKLQLIRVDGKYLQTLYCATGGNGLYEVQWSTDQKLIAFILMNASSKTTSVELLNTRTGSVQTELTTPGNASVNLSTWLDTQRIYLTNQQIDQPPNIIYLLDTRKGANQHMSDLTTVFNGSFAGFDSSYNGEYVYINACSCGQGGDTGPGTISVGSATGGHVTLLYATTKYAITEVRAVTPKTLLFVIHNELAFGPADTSQNGLWKINTDGTGLTRLAIGNTGLASWSQFPWSNVARDSSLYAVQVSSKQSIVLLIGSLNGGAPTTIASAPNPYTSLENVGWTKM